MKFSIEVIDDDNSTLFNDEHPANEFWPIATADDGIIIEVSDEHLLNEFSPIDVIDFERTH